MFGQSFAKAEEFSMLDEALAWTVFFEHWNERLAHDLILAYGQGERVLERRQFAVDRSVSRA